jgi:tRNA modification GTPase
MAKASSSGLSSDLAGGADTIVARATPPGRGALALIRVSGPQTAACAARVCPELSFDHGHKARLTTIVDSAGERLERAVAVPFPGPRSYTGEDMLEVTIHGSPYLVSSVIEAFVAAGARPAGAGEFTRRAVANGKFDLVQAEAIRDLVAADTAWQHRNAREQLAGALSREFKRLRGTLVALLAAIEASLDYEAQAVEVSPDEISVGLESARQQLSALLARAAAGERIRSGLRLVIVGPPNAGKSTLFNLLCGSERAIVSPHPGTTRDLLETELDIGGVPVVIQDTAGLREDGDAVEAEGHRRALAAAATADAALLLWASDSDAEPPGPPESLPVIRVRSKADLLAGDQVRDGWLGVSCHTGAGVEALRAELLRTALEDIPDLGGAVAISARHRRAVESARSELDALDLARPETAAQNVRWALRAIDELIGEVADEEVLDEIYSSFCIGK